MYSELSKTCLDSFLPGLKASSFADHRGIVGEATKHGFIEEESAEKTSRELQRTRSTWQETKVNLYYGQRVCVINVAWLVEKARRGGPARDLQSVRKNEYTRIFFVFEY